MGLGYPLSIAISNGKTVSSKVKFRRKEKTRSSSHNTPLNLVLGYFPGRTRRWAFWMLVLIYFGQDVCHLIWGGNVNVLKASFSSVSLMKRLWTSICLFLLCWIGLCAMSIADLLSHYKLIKIFFYYANAWRISLIHMPSVIPSTQALNLALALESNTTGCFFFFHVINFHTRTNKTQLWICDPQLEPA